MEKEFKAILNGVPLLNLERAWSDFPEGWE
jgi:hypothetical protein